MSATARLGVRDFEIHWISRGFRISDWISVYFTWISGFLDFKVGSGFHQHCSVVHFDRSTV